MLAIVGTLIGLLGSFLPEVLKFFKAKEDHKHEKEMFDLQIKLADKQHQYRVDEMNITADIEESKALYQAAEVRLTGSKIFDGIIALYNGSVRPTVTYAFVVFYGLVKYAQYQVLIENQWTSWEVVKELWGSEDFACFMTIIGFWFGGRLIKHMLQQYKGAK